MIFIIFYILYIFLYFVWSKFTWSTLDRKEKSATKPRRGETIQMHTRELERNSTKNTQNNFGFGFFFFFYLLIFRFVVFDYKIDWLLLWLLLWDQYTIWLICSCCWSCFWCCCFFWCCSSYLFVLFCKRITKIVVYGTQ